MAPKTLANGQAQNGQSSTNGAKGTRVKKAKRQPASTNNELDQQENLSKSGNLTKEAPSKALLASAKPIITASKEPSLTRESSTSTIAKNNINNNNNNNNNVNTDGLKTAHVNTFDTLATIAATQKQQVPATPTKITNKSNQITSSSSTSTSSAEATALAVAAVTSPSTTTASTSTTTTKQQESTPSRNMINSNSDNKSPTTPATLTPIASTITTATSQQTAVNVAENEALNALINNMTSDNISDCVSVTSKSSSARISTIDPEEGVKIDTARVQRRFSSQNSQEESSTCKICSKHVYQMERMMAEKYVYHKQCFRCAECKIQLRMDNYSSHESQLYCKAHHRQLFQPKAKFGEDNDVEPVTKSTPQIDEYLLNRGQLGALSYDPNNNQGGRWKQMVICENEPAELPKDVVRCDTKVDDGIEALNLNLSNIRERFEQQANESQQHQKSSTPIIDKPSINIRQTLANFDLKLQQQNSFDNGGSSQTSTGMPSSPSTGHHQPTMVRRSESLMMRLKKYESVISGEKNEDDSSSGEENCTTTDNMLDSNGQDLADNLMDSTRNISDVASVDLSSLKQKWESGHVNKNKENLAHEHKEELSKVRQSLALGRNQSVKNIYEKAVKEAVSTKPLKSESVVLNFPSKANSLKEKFELGLVNDTGDSDTDEPTKLDQLRQEKMNDLSVFDEGEISAREARNLFKQIDRRLSSASQQQQNCSFDGTNLPNISNSGETNGYQSLGSKGALINGTVTAAARRRFERQPVRCNTLADIGDNSEPIEVVKCSQPGAKEDISVETTRLREKFNFFENYREEPKTPRRFEMTPPREIVANGRKYSTVTNSDSSDDDDNGIGGDSLTNGTTTCPSVRSLKQKSSRKSSSGKLTNGHHVNGIVVDNNNNSNTDNDNDDGIIKCSITNKLDDVPKTDTTRRMLDKFKQLQENNNTTNTSNNNNTNQPIFIGNINTNINLIKQNLLSPASAELLKDGGRPCLKRITPPRDYTLENDSSDDERNSDIQQRDPNIIRCADKLDDQIQVEPEKARSLRMKFENWAANQTSLDNDDNNNNINGYDGKGADEQQFVPSVDTTRNLKAKFEAFGREENLRPVTIPRPQARVNRFVVKDMAE